MAIVYPTNLTVSYRRTADDVLETPSAPLVLLRRVGGPASQTSLTLGSGLTEQSAGVLVATVPGKPGDYHVIAGSSSQDDQVTPAELAYSISDPAFPSNQ
jgi:hypothetical protein